jgi:hypothetical protein
MMHENVRIGMTRIDQDTQDGLDAQDTDFVAVALNNDEE